MPETKRYIIEYRNGGDYHSDKRKAKVFHDFVDADSPAQAVVEFWKSSAPVFKGSYKIEVLDVQEA